MSTILIKNAMILTMNDKILNGDIFIEDDKIKEISKTIDKKADKEIDSTRNACNARTCQLSYTCWNVNF